MKVITFVYFLSVCRIWFPFWTAQWRVELQPAPSSSCRSKRSVLRSPVLWLLRPLVVVAFSLVNTLTAWQHHIALESTTLF